MGFSAKVISRYSWVLLIGVSILGAIVWRFHRVLADNVATSRQAVVSQEDFFAGTDLPTDEEIQQAAANLDSKRIITDQPGGSLDILAEAGPRAKFAAAAVAKLLDSKDIGMISKAALTLQAFGPEGTAAGLAELNQEYQKGHHVGVHFGLDYIGPSALPVLADYAMHAPPREREMYLNILAKRISNRNATPEVKQAIHELLPEIQTRLSNDFKGMAPLLEVLGTDARSVAPALKSLISGNPHDEFIEQYLQVIDPEEATSHDMPGLIQIVNNENCPLDTRKNALCDLARLRPVSPETIQLFVKLVGSGSSLAGCAMERFERLGTPALPALVRIFIDQPVNLTASNGVEPPNPVHRRPLPFPLDSKAGRFNGSNWREIISHVMADDPATDAILHELLTAIVFPNGATEAARITDEQWHQVLDLTMLLPDKGLKIQLAALTGSSKNIRHYVSYLLPFQDADALPAIACELKNKNPDVRFETAKAIAMFVKYKQGSNGGLFMRSPEDLRLRSALLKASPLLVRAITDSAPQTIDYTPGQFSLTMRTWMKGILDCGDGRIVSALLELVKSADPAVRGGAAYALGGRNTAFASLVLLLDDADFSVQMNAALALAIDVSNVRNHRRDDGASQVVQLKPEQRTKAIAILQKASNSVDHYFQLIIFQYIQSLKVDGDS